jgi:POT family proton-dependent oligopeptide transporter
VLESADGVTRTPGHRFSKPLYPPELRGRSDPLFRGHPKGLFYLAFTEAWERFSYYGMTALLALYMIDQLLLPGHVGNVAGFQALRHSLEFFAGPLSNQALAARVVGLYTGFVYFTPLLGGLIADRWIGQRNAVVIGAVSMSAGHLAMTFDRAFLPALLMLVVGSGFLKGNISAQVGALYPPDDEARRNHGFVIFSTGINVGSVLGPLLCGLLAQVYGWSYGFGIAAVFMMFGLVTYLHGYRYLPARVDPPASESSRLTRADWHIIAVLGAVTALSVFQSTAYYQLFNVFPVWMQQRVQPTVAGFHVPIPWYIALNSFTCIVLVPPLLWAWRQQASRGGEPDDVTKIGIGAWLAAGSNLILAAASVRPGDALVNPVWPILYSATLGVAFLYQWPTLLALVSRAAPAIVNSTMMGIVFMSLFVSNILIGWIGGYYERMSPARFWGIHVVIAAAGGLLLLLFGRRLTRALRTPYSERK